MVRRDDFAASRTIWRVASAIFGFLSSVVVEGVANASVRKTTKERNKENRCTWPRVSVYAACLSSLRKVVTHLVTLESKPNCRTSTSMQETESGIWRSEQQSVGNS